MPTRRQFIGQASLAATGFLLYNKEWFASKTPIGLQLYTLRNEITKDVKGTIARVAQIGFQDVETFGYGAGKYFGLSVPDFAAIVAQNNLKSSSGHYMMMNYLSKGDEDELKKTVEDSLPMKHDFFTIPYLTEPLRKSLDDYKTLADRLNHAGEVVKAAGMKLAYHNHNFEFKDWGGGQTGYDILMKQTDPKLVNFEMDIYWVSNAGVDPIQLMQSNPGRIQMWHVKDMDNTPEKTFTEVGTGVIDYKKIFTYRKKEGIKHFFLEQDQIKIDPYESITKSYEYIKNNLV